MKGNRRHFIAALTAGVTGTLAGCGGTESATPSEASTETDTDSPVETQTDTDSPMETETETDATGTPDSAGQTVVVAPDGSLRFSPESFTVPAGSTVTWEWGGNGHNVKAETTPSGSDWSGTPGDGSTTYGSGHTYSHTFETAGEYEYYCAPHQSVGMTGSFTVTEQ
ncbi:plastocyanin/azurin family copper-binding protein [Haloarcula sp. S1CR25-12]|uniref:Plastocyanin/azurin family copper-binding protein n=1 Tax=Haloarcula saliterrae TaxID=2950534 RepID=A0ABU2FD94_9EURY|nr:plastocyanin/azurin family copper-binding protein [Haloarcula sp. S1CR25-12]MDS0259810.1 plastocyanin/azurin family copper-binding protein [Haloarcula sp. S1CR25-12]